jgi:UDP-glucose 4-epimerase
VDGTINVLEAARRAAGLKTLVTTSSETVYGAVETYPTPEELGPGKPLSMYAASKAAADLLTQQFPAPKGARFLVARSAMGAGPRSSPSEQVVSRFVQNSLQGKPLKFPGERKWVSTPGTLSIGTMPAHGHWENVSVNVAHPTRDVSPALNFVHGVDLILQTPDAKGPVYNLGSGTEINILELAERVIKTLGEGSLEYDPAFSYRPGEVGYRTALSIEKARKDLGYESIVTLEDAVRLTAQWMRECPNYFEERRVPARARWGSLSSNVGQRKGKGV